MRTCQNKRTAPCPLSLSPLATPAWAVRPSRSATQDACRRLHKHLNCAILIARAPLEMTRPRISSEPHICGCFSYCISRFAFSQSALTVDASSALQAVKFLYFWLFLFLISVCLLCPPSALTGSGSQVRLAADDACATCSARAAFTPSSLNFTQWNG